MTTNKPEVLAYATHHDEPMLFPDRKEAAAYCEDGEEPVALIRLSDYEALQAEYRILESELATVKKVAYGNVDLLDECEKLRAECEKLRSIISDLKGWDCDVRGGFLSIPVDLRSRMQEAIVGAMQGDRP